MAENRNPGALAGATGAASRSSKGPDTASLTQRIRKRHKPGTLYRVTPSAGDSFPIMVSGRDEWAPERLREAGRKGCTPITEPAPRWSAYIHNLRKLGVEIETITEPHEGQFPGHRARYVLRSTVSIMQERAQA
jgi:hypothetical protein